MAQSIQTNTTPAVGTPVRASNPAYQAYQILHWGFVAAPVIVGIDKFLMLLTEWQKYLWPAIPRLLHIQPVMFMYFVGVVEMIAGLVVAIRPRIGAYIVAAWLVGIIINLLLLGNYYDVVLRDFGLFLGAMALGRLGQEFDRR